MIDFISQYFSSASLVVSCVVILLALASVFSWTVIFQRGFYTSKAAREVKRFEKRFWRAESLEALYHTLDKEEDHEGLTAMFCAAYKEHLRLAKRPEITNAEIIEGVQRAMRITSSYEEEALEANLPFLATVGSISPYVGLFGTVWGIMMSFHALGGVEQVTISMVAPGISEALIATAMGLFAAIPAVIFYNRFISRTGRILNRYDAFQEEFVSLLQHKIAPRVLGVGSAEKEAAYE